MTIDKEEIVHITEDKKAHFGMLITTASTFILLAGLVWNQATWQAQTSKDINQMQNNIVTVQESVEENGSLIKLNTIRLSDLEARIHDGVTRETLYHWLLQLKKDNPAINVPQPPLKGSK